MVHLAQQIKSAKSQIALRLDEYSSEIDKLATTILHGFRSSVGILIQIKNRKMDTHLVAQAAANFCTVIAASEVVKSMDKACLSTWPESKPPLGEYHFAAKARSGLELAAMFHELVANELAIARLYAFPNQFIDHLDLEQLAPWIESLWSELVQRHPNLIEWQCHKLHQWRDELSNQIQSEYRQLFPPKKQVVKQQDFETLVCEEMRQLPDEQITHEVKNRLLRLLREFQDAPAEESASTFGGVFNITSDARTVYFQQLSPLIVGIGRCITLANQRELAVPAIRKLEQMLRVSDIESARSIQYDVAVELNSIQSTRPKLTPMAEKAYGWIVLLEKKYPNTEYSKRSLPDDGGTAYTNLCKWSKNKELFQFVEEATRYFESEFEQNRIWLAVSRPKDS